MVRHFAFRTAPGGILIGYLLVLFAATAGVVVFPFSFISLSLLVVVVGAFYVVAIIVLSMFSSQPKP
jgi:hypothetical protein